MSSFDSARGPFSAELNSLLSESFGQSLDGIHVERGQGDRADALDARAYTVGSTISLGHDIREDATDLDSMEVIAHEVAHALAGGGAGRKEIDSGRDDAGEIGAYDAGSSFRDFIGSGAEGPAPQLTPAYGGEATIHRFEAGEHADAIDNADETLEGAGVPLDNEALALMQRRVTLSNGVEVSQGEITAMMGDFYGAYTTDDNGNENFDPMASFRAMDNADPKEMKALQARIAEEQASLDAAKKTEDGLGFESTANADLEDITDERRKTKDEVSGATTGYSYMQLAERNTNHFNTKDESGTNNNLGAYAVFHEEAIKAAAAANDPSLNEEDRKKAEDRALALEASSQHFLTDRFASGHQFDKAAMVEQASSDKFGNIHASVIHDRLNDRGTWLENGDDEWFAMGDGHWADATNKENRERCAQTSMSSYGDINDVLTGAKDASEFEGHYLDTAHETAPEFSDAENDGALEDGTEVSTWDIIKDKIVEAPLVPAMAERAWNEHIENPAEDWLKDKTGYDPEWADKLDVKLAGPGEIWNDAGDAAGKAWDWTNETGHELADGAGKAWGEVEDFGGDVAEDAGEVIDDAADLGGEVIDGAGDAYNYVADGAAKKAAEAEEYLAKKKNETIEAIKFW